MADSQPDNPDPQTTAIDRPYAFQDEFPPKCPPDDAKPTEATFYACHYDNPPSQKDFTTAAQRGVFRNSCQCRRRSHSIVLDLADARGLCKSYPDKFRFVSIGNLTKLHGVCAATPGSFPSHHSLWRYSSVSMHEIFASVVK